MSQENVETVRLAFEAVSRRDKTAFLAACDPEVETVPYRDFPESAPTRGVEAVWDLFVELQGSWQQGALKPVELIEAGGGKVVTHAYGEMLGEASGATVAASVWQVVTFGNGKMLRAGSYGFSRLELEAVTRLSFRGTQTPLWLRGVHRAV